MMEIAELQSFRPPSGASTEPTPKSPAGATPGGHQGAMLEFPANHTLPYRASCASSGITSRAVRGWRNRRPDPS